MRLFFRKKISPNGPSFNFLEFSDRADVEKSQRVPLSVFWHCEIFFQKIFFHQKFPAFNFLMICDRMDEKSQSIPSGAPNKFNFWVFPVPKKRILRHFEVLLMFLSLRYGADLGRSRLVIFLKTKINLN